MTFQDKYTFIRFLQTFLSIYRVLIINRVVSSYVHQKYKNGLKDSKENIYNENIIPFLGYLIKWF